MHVSSQEIHIYTHAYIYKYTNIYEDVYIGSYIHICKLSLKEIHFYK